MIRRTLPALALLLAGCGDSPAAEDPREVTASEQTALDEAAEMIEAQRPPQLAEPASPAATPPPATKR